MPKQETMDVDQFRRAAGIVAPSKPQGNARPKHAPGVMNKTEARMDWELDLLKRDGQIKEYFFESVKLKLAKATWYTPDFFIVWTNGTLECRECKGHWEDDARAKFKIAAEKFRQFKFTAYKPIKGGWDVEEIRP